MGIKLDSIEIENFRKLKQISDTSVGRSITVISGHNGVGKSSIMSLISSASGTSEKRTNGQKTQPEFDEYFYIEPTEPFKDYRIFLTYSTDGDFKFRKRISFDDYRNSGRGIRALPRSTKNREGQTVKDGITETREIAGITGSGRVPIPTIYISSSRILPPREAEIEINEVSNNSNFRKKHLNKADYKFNSNT